MNLRGSNELVAVFLLLECNPPSFCHQIRKLVLLGTTSLSFDKLDEELGKVYIETGRITPQVNIILEI